MNTCDSPNLLRRLAAIFYDLLLLAAVLLIAFIPFTALVGDSAEGYNPLATLYLLGVAYLYFGWHWTHGGQTLGMKSWKMRLVKEDGGTVDWATAAVRFLVAALSWAALGAGYLWALTDPRRRTWHDRVSKTRLEMVEYRKKPA